MASSRQPNFGRSNFNLLPSLRRVQSGVPKTAGGTRAIIGLKFRAPHRLVRDIEPALCQEILHVAIAQCEAEIEPDRVLDDRWRKAMAGIGERVIAPC